MLIEFVDSAHYAQLKVFIVDNPYQAGATVGVSKYPNQGTKVFVVNAPMYADLNIYIDPNYIGNNYIGTSVSKSPSDYDWPGPGANKFNWKNWFGGIIGFISFLLVGASVVIFALMGIIIFFHLVEHEPFTSADTAPITQILLVAGGSMAAGLFLKRYSSWSY